MMPVSNSIILTHVWRDFAKLPLQLFLHQICVFFNESVPIVHYILFLLSLYHCLFLCTSYPACMLSTNSSHMALRAFLYSLIYSLTFLDLAEVFLSMTLTGLQYMYIERVLGGCNPSFTPFWPLSTVVLHRMSLMWEMGNKSRSPHFLFITKFSSVLLTLHHGSAGKLFPGNFIMKRLTLEEKQTQTPEALY